MICHAHKSARVDGKVRNEKAASLDMAGGKRYHQV